MTNHEVISIFKPQHPPPSTLVCLIIFFILLFGGKLQLDIILVIISISLDHYLKCKALETFSRQYFIKQDFFKY